LKAGALNYSTRPKEIIKMICDGCDKESADEFKFCPHCGKAFAPKPSVIESSPSPSPEVHSVTVTRTDESQPVKDGVAGTGIRVGTWVFGGFSAISLLVSIVKGLVPIYLLEAAGWAGAAWYWQGKKTHSNVAKAIVIVLAVLVGLGEVVHIVSQAGSKPNIFDDAANTTTSTSPYAVSGSRSSGNILDRPSTSASDYSAAGSPYQNQASAAVGSSSAPDIAEIEQQAGSLYNQKRYADARPLFVQACDGGEMKACNYLGYLYLVGLGVPQDYSEALRWYHKAADKGYDYALLAIAGMYERGEGVPQDRGEAYFWYSLSCAAPEPSETLDKWRQWRDEAAAKLTPAKLAKIQERARRWVKTHPAIHN
jgi:hypothetical protein